MLNSYLRFLYCHEAIHLIVALLLSLLIYQWYKSLPLVLLAIVSGVIIDVDHLFDLFMDYGLNFSAADILSGNYRVGADQIFIPLHSWELVAIIWFFCWWRKRTYIGVAITVPIIGHILVDQFTYAMHPLAYSFIYRAVHGFGTIYLDLY